MILCYPRPMKLRTVKDLKIYLNTHSLSPERFAILCGISNMTVRRWVKNSDEFELPKKYWPIFDHAFLKADLTEDNPSHTFNFQDGFPDLEKHVHGLGTSARSEETLKTEFDEKTTDLSIGKGLIDKVKLLFQALTGKHISHYHRTLVLGAIVYFISPIDLIPDLTPVVGYLDDYAVVTMVLTSISPVLAKTVEGAKKKPTANAT